MPSRTRSGSSPVWPSSIRPTALMIWPGVQKPHWKASWAMKAACTGWQVSPSARPSMVSTSAPSWLIASARQELMRRPSSRTVQAPHWPRSQPFLVPVRSRRSRSRSSRVTRGSSSSTVRRRPLMVSVMGRLMRRSDENCFGMSACATILGPGAARPECRPGCGIQSPARRLRVGAGTCVTALPPALAIKIWRHASAYKGQGRIGCWISRPKEHESRGRMRSAIASVCWRRRRRCSARAARRRASRPWRGAPASGSARSTGISRPGRPSTRRSIGVRWISSSSSPGISRRRRRARSRRCAAGCGRTWSSSRPRRAWRRRLPSPPTAPRISRPTRWIG